MADFSTHLMLDDVNTDVLLAHAKPAFALAPYVNGRYANLDAVRRAYPRGKFLLTIDVLDDASAGAQCLDIEHGDATTASAPGWVGETRAAGRKHRDLRWYPKLYTSIDNGESLLATLADAGIKRDQYMLWSAHYTYQPHICGPATCGAAVQADATQWTDSYLGLSLDASLCYGYFFAGPPKSPLHHPVPKHKSGPARHVADGTVTLDHFLARARLGYVGTVETSARKLSDRHLREFLDYLAIGPASAMPKGLVFWTAR